MAGLEVGKNVAGGLARSGRGLAQRLGPQQVKRAAERVTELGFVEADPAARIVDAVAKGLDLAAQPGLTLTGGVLQFGLAGGAFLRVLLQPFNGGGVGIGVGAADAGAQSLLNDLGEAAQFEPDGLGLADKRAQHAIFGALRIDEIMAEDLAVGLELAIYAAIALLQPGWIPRQIKMNEVPAVGLEIESLAGSVGGNEDAEGISLGRLVEGAFQVVAFLWGGWTVEDFKPGVGAVGPRDRGLKLGAEVAGSVLVFGEDDEAEGRPRCSRRG